MDQELADKRCERGILGLVLAILVFGPLATGAVRPQDFLVIQGLTVVAVILWITRIWMNPNLRLLWPPVCWGVVAFVGYAIWRYQNAEIEYTARTELIKVLVYACLFFVVINNLNRQESAQVVTVTLILLGMGVALYAGYQFLTGSDKVWHFIRPAQYAGRGSGTYICPNHLAGFLEMILPLGLAYTLMSRLEHATKVLLGYAAAVILTGIGVSVSRGGWVATALALFVFFGVLISQRHYRLVAVIAFAILTSASIWFVVNAQLSQKRFEQMFVGGKVDDLRFLLWKPALQIWHENFWWGAGPAHHEYRFRQFRPEVVQMSVDYTHNDYLNTLADWGLAGVILITVSFGLLFLGVFRCWRFVRRSNDGLTTRHSNRAAFVLGASTGLVTILLHSVVDFNMHIPANAIVAVTLMALLAGYWRFATERWWIKSSLGVRLGVTLLGGAAALYLSQQALLRGTEWMLVHEADQAANYSTEQIALLNQAHRVDPMNFSTTYRIGEMLRLLSWQKGPDTDKLAYEAMEWFDVGMRTNPYDPYNFLRYGMCLDWVGKHDQAGKYFDQAVKLDPNGYYVVAHYGWHLVQLGKLAEARPWFQRSMRLKYSDVAESYLEIIDQRLREAP